MSFRLYAVRIFSAYWQAAIHFYRETLGLTERFSDADMGWAEFDVGGPSLAIERAQDDDPEHRSLLASPRVAYWRLSRIRTAICLPC